MPWTLKSIERTFAESRSETDDRGLDVHRKPLVLSLLDVRGQHAVPPPTLRHVQGVVGRLEQTIDVLRVDTERGQTTAHRERTTRLELRERNRLLLDRSANAITRFESLGFRRADEENAEPPASAVRDEVSVADVLDESPGQRFEHSVALKTTVPLVVDTEMVDVEKEERNRRIGSLRRSDRTSRLLAETLRVVEPGDLVARRRRRRPSSDLELENLRSLESAVDRKQIVQNDDADVHGIAMSMAKPHVVLSDALPMRLRDRSLELLTGQQVQHLRVHVDTALVDQIPDGTLDGLEGEDLTLRQRTALDRLATLHRPTALDHRAERVDHCLMYVVLRHQSTSASLSPRTEYPAVAQLANRARNGHRSRHRVGQDAKGRTKRAERECARPPPRAARGPSHSARLVALRAESPERDHRTGLRRTRDVHPGTYRARPRTLRAHPRVRPEHRSARRSAFLSVARSRTASERSLAFLETREQAIAVGAFARTPRDALTAIARPRVAEERLAGSLPSSVQRQVTARRVHGLEWRETRVGPRERQDVMRLGEGVGRRTIVRRRDDRENHPDRFFVFA